MALSPGRGSWPVPHLCPGGGAVGGGRHVSYPVCAPQAIQLHKGLLCLRFIFPEPLQHLFSPGETGEQGWWGCAPCWSAPRGRFCTILDKALGHRKVSEGTKPSALEPHGNTRVLLAIGGCFSRARAGGSTTLAATPGCSRTHGLLTLTHTPSWGPVPPRCRREALLHLGRAPDCHSQGTSTLVEHHSHFCACHPIWNLQSSASLIVF